MKPVSRREFLKVAGFGAAATALAACAPAAPSAPKPAEPAAGEVKEAPAAASSGELEGKLVFWGHQDHPIYSAGQAFMKKYPKVVFEQPEMAEWDKAVESALAAGSGLPDMVWQEATNVQRDARRGILMDVTDVVKKHEAELAPAKLSEALYQGKYWGMPGDITPNNLWWRPDLVEKAGVGPITEEIKYDEFLQMAKEVKAKIDASLFVQEETVDGQGKLMFTVPFYSLGGNFTDETGEQVLVDSEIGIQAMEYAKQAWDTGAGLNAGWFSPPYWGAIKDGKLAGTYSPPWMRGFFQTEVTSPEQGQGKWRNQLVPVYPGAVARTNVWGGATLVSFSTNPQPDLVKAFMEFTFCTMEGAQVTGDWGIIPPYLPWLKSEFKNTKQTLFEAGWDWTGEIVKALEQMRTDFYRMPGYGIADGAMAKFMPAILKGEKSVKDGMKEYGEYVRSENAKLLESLK